MRLKGGRLQTDKRKYSCCGVFSHATGNLTVALTAQDVTETKSLARVKKGLNFIWIARIFGIITVHANTYWKRY